MRKLPLFLLLTLFTLSNPALLKSQQWIIDSLEKKVLTAEPGIDEIDYLLGLTRFHMFARKDHDKMMEVASEVFDKSKAIGYVDGEIYANVFKGMILFNTEEGNEYLTEAFHQAQREGSNDALLFSAYVWANFTAETDQMALDTLRPIFLKVKTDKTVTRKNIANSLKALAHYSYVLGQSDKAFEYLDQATALFELTQKAPEVNAKLGRVSAMDADKGGENLLQCHNYYWRIYLKLGDTEKALEYAVKALALSREFNNPESIAYELAALTSIKRRMGLYEESLIHLTEADSIYRSLNFTRNIAGGQRQFAQIYELMGDYNLAEAAYFKAYEVTKETTYKGYLELIGLVDLYLKTEQLDKAETTLTDLMSEESNDTTFLATMLRLKGNLQFKKGQYESAIQTLEQANGYYTIFESYELVAKNDLIISKAYAAINQTDKAINLAEKTLVNTMNFEDATGIKENYLNLSEIYEKAGQTDKALTNYKQYHFYTDSLYTADAQSKLKEEQVRQNIYTYQEEKEAAEREADLLSTQNKLYLALATALLVILLVGSYLFIQLRKTRQKLEEQNQKLQRLNQTKDKFFGIIAHDIRSPIVALDGVGQQMNYYLKKEKFDKLLKISGLVDSTAKRLNALLDNLLSWALLQTGTIPYHPKAIPLHETTSDIFSIFKPLADLKNINLVNNIQTDLEVFADDSALNAIIRNLISNALKFTPEGGMVSIATQEIGDKVEIMVNDTGTGIDAERLKKMFTLERKSTKGTGGEKGTGLGLILCKELVELNKGTIKVESEVGKGTRFTFSMPMAA